MSELQWYEQELTLQQAMNFIEENLRTSVRNFVAIGFYLKEIRNRKLYQEDGCQNFEEFVRKYYDRDKGWASKCIKVNDQLSKNGNSPLLAEAYQSYKVYQLVELAYLTEEQRELVSPDMTVKEIQAIRRPEPVMEVAMSQPEPVEEPPTEAATVATDEELEQKRKAEWTLRCEILKEMCDSICYIHSYTLEQSRYSMAAIRNTSMKDYGFGFGDDGQGHSRYASEYKNGQYHVEEFKGKGKWVFQAGEIEQHIWNYNGRDWHLEHPETEPEETTASEPVSNEIVVDTNTCPPDNGSCRRQEWGTSPEEQKAGHKECVKCWEDWKKLQVAIRGAVSQREEDVASIVLESESEGIEAGIGGQGDRKYTYDDVLAEIEDHEKTMAVFLESGLEAPIVKLTQMRMDAMLLLKDQMEKEADEDDCAEEQYYDEL